MIHTYSLANHLLTVGFPYEVAQSLNLRDSVTGNLLTNFTIGGPGEEGEGSLTGNITVSRQTDLFSTEGDATGSWIHNKNLDKHGTISIDINQLSDRVIKLIHLCKIYKSVQTAMGGLTITLSAISPDGNTEIVQGVDCVINKIPDLQFQASAQSQTWTFNCGQVLYKYGL